MPQRAAILAADGGNSKTDLVLAAADGTVLASLRGGTVSHQTMPEARGLGREAAAELAMARLDELARRAAGEAGLDGRRGPLAEVGVLCLAGADFPSDVRLLGTSVARHELADQQIILNDAFAPLRAGTDRAYGIALICGAGVNAAGIGRTGRTARFAAVGEISGDWGGGSSLGYAALAAGVRAGDGRGPATSLAQLVPRHFGLARAATLTERLYDGRVSTDRLRELAPVVFSAAMAGDPVARGVVDRLADELATMAVAIGRRLHLLRAEADVVLAGGVFRARDAAFYARLEEGVRAAMPRARLCRLMAPPVVGAALLALDRLPGAAPDAAARLRRTFPASPST